MNLHVGDRRFGFDVLSNESKISELDQILSTSEKTLESIPAAIVTQECYDEYFGIYSNSSQGSSNLALVAMHEPEDLAICDPYDLYLERYLAANVLKYTGMSFTEFTGLTKDRAEAILRRCDAMATKEDAEVGNLVNGMKAGPGKM